MNWTRDTRIHILTIILAIASTHALAQESAFSFNGRLSDAGAPATGLFDLRIGLFAAETGGTAVAGPLTLNDVPVTNGLFTVTLDFGSAVFDGSARWLALEVRPGASVGAFTVLSPRLPVLSSPYAIRAAVATTVSGNAGLRIEPNVTSPNVIGGHSGNFVGAGVAGANIGGGGEAARLNGVTGNFGTVSGGRGNLVAAVNGTVGGGQNNQIAPAGTEATIGGGIENYAGGYLSTIGGGAVNTNLSTGGTVGGGGANRLEFMLYGTIAGGGENKILLNAHDATIAGGAVNTIQGDAEYAAIGGGVVNTIQTNSDASTIAGGTGNVIQTNGSVNVIGGGTENVIGGWRHLNGIPLPETTATGAVIAGGRNNRARRPAATVSGGRFNVNESANSVIAGGLNNDITGVPYSDSGTNCCEGAGNTIGGGEENWIRPFLVQPFGSYGTIGGGYGNVVHGFAGTVPGGARNFAGSYGFAAGHRAEAGRGCFVWADSLDAVFASTRDDEFSIRAAGGMRLQSDRGISLSAADRPLITREWDPFTSGNYQGQGRWGVFMEPHALVLGIPAIAGKQFRVARYNANSTVAATLMTVDQNGDVFATSFNPSSDRHVKHQFAAVNAAEILDKVARLAIQTWTFTNDQAQTRHIGPMAQDFHSAFAVGTDEKHIATVDADGVALAAIQGLNRKVELRSAQLEKQLQAKDREIEGLRARLERLEGLLAKPHAANR